MGMWTEDEFVARAQTLARAHVGAQTPLNDLVEKVAREAELTPDAIRTLGRLTNVAVFQELFQKKAAAASGDRLVEFEPGDPEIVIQRVVKSADLQAAAAAAATTDSPEKTAAELPDLMRGVRGYATELEKVAAAEDAAEERAAPQPLQTMRLRKMADELEVTASMTSQRWDVGVSKLAAEFRRAPGYGPSYAEFEKAALSEWGTRAVPELNVIREELRLPAVVFSSEKVASLRDSFVYEGTSQLTALGELLDAREKYQIIKAAQLEVSRRLAK